MAGKDVMKLSLSLSEVVHLDTRCMGSLEAVEKHRVINSATNRVIYSATIGSAQLQLY